jgi:hypothetical protein
MRADADHSLRGIARLVGEFLERLDLGNVTVVGNDTGGALVQLLICDGAARVARIVLVSCDAFDNFPPGLTGKTLVLTGKLSPTMFGLFMQQMRLKPLRRLPIAFGWLTKRGDAATARWIKPVLRQPEIRRDTVQVLRSISAERNLMLEAAECLPTFDLPALVVWARKDRVMPPEHGRRPAPLVSPSSSRKDGSSRYRTATRSSPLTSPPASRRPSGNAPLFRRPDRSGTRDPRAGRDGCRHGRASSSRLPQPVAERRGGRAAVVVPIHDRDRTEACSHLPRRSPDAVP